MTKNGNNDEARKEAARARQAQAVEMATVEPLMIITGGPGVGKTKTIQDILRECDGSRILLAAPTGKAARRMSEACHGFPASTIHRLLEYSPSIGTFTRNRSFPISADLLIIDESSMIDVFLMKSLMAAISQDTRVIFVGDKDQLPSVGPGNILRDMLACKKIPTIELEYIWRQSEHSWIPVNAQKINRGETIFPLDPDSEDFFVHIVEDPMDARAKIVDLVINEIPKRFDATKEQIQLLAPQKKGPLGIDTGTEDRPSLNEELQNVLNPLLDGGAEPLWGFRIGDKVINIRNNYDEDVMNGETGVVADMHIEGNIKTLLVDFGEDKVVGYTRDNIGDLKLAYALTIHKSQGSEWKHVVIPIHSSNYIMLNRNLAYTAITRARQSVHIVCNERGIGRAIKNAAPNNRNTYLSRLLASDDLLVHSLEDDKAPGLSPLSDSKATEPAPQPLIQEVDMLPSYPGYHSNKTTKPEPEPERTREDEDWDRLLRNPDET